MARSVPLAALLCLEAWLLFWHLDLLPLWGDELFTLNTAQHPVGEIISILERDVHPPLYYALLHAWAALPLPWAGVAALRAFSALWALLATLLLDLFWTRSWKGVERWLALGLFALSPCLLLYGRMARSYSMQVALAVLCLGMLRRWMQEPASTRLACGAFAAMVALLYTHYVPGVAVLAGFLLTGWSSVGLRRIAVFSSAAAVAYFPWVIIFIRALRRWGEASAFAANYAVSGHSSFEHVIKAGFGLVSLTIGESFLAASLVLVPVILLLAVLGARTPGVSRQFIAMLAIAAGVGYIGVARWESYPFIPARLLWLLPFLSLAVALGIAQLRRPAIRIGVVLALLLSYASSDLSYFRRENFLNLGYVAPLPEIAARLNREARAEDLIIVDAYNTDAQALGRLLSGRTPYIILEENKTSEARRLARSAGTVWIARNTRDVSPGRITTQVQSEACAGRLERDTLLVPYAPWQQAAMRIAGLGPPPTHFYQLTACDRAPGQ
ncbi:MAG: hypothetical protein LAP38_27255 [Acidobacteriia bacterium]|nr:hypothetical protein [Terriglobia bacterium]